MLRLSGSRLPFVVAAALGDAVVESISNSGAFGPAYFDRNHLSVIPTLIAGLLIVLEINGARRLGRLATRRRGPENDWLVEAATELSARPVALDLPYVFALQIAALFVMESVEQLAFGGRLLGGTVWLGGPLLLSFAVHAAFGTLCTALLDSFMRAVVRTVASLIETAIAFVWLSTAAGTRGSFLWTRGAAAYVRARAPFVRRSGGRAPPLPTPIRALQS